MSSQLFIFARITAWLIVLAAVAEVMLHYDALPELLPVTRWTTAPKSWFLALRVPLINLLSLGLVEILARPLCRSQFPATGRDVSALLMATVAAKAAIEAAGILRPLTPPDWTILPLGGVVALGLGLAVIRGREFFRSQNWRRLEFSRAERAAIALLIAGIVLLNLPLLLR